MASGTTITWDDTVLPFQLDVSDIRGRVVRLDGALDEILSQHEYPPQIEALVAETAECREAAERIILFCQAHAASAA